MSEIEINEEDMKKMIELIEPMNEREKIAFLFDAGYNQALVDLELIDASGVLIP